MKMQMTFLIIQIVLAVLLIAIVLFQKTGSDGIANLGGGNGNAGLVNNHTAASILTKTTMILAALFMINSLILANISSKNKKNSSVVEKHQQQKNKEIDVPVAK
jgi:preprotein translocase subunit SecG